MPSIQTLVLKDGATTPVNHTFTPADVKAGVGLVVESDGTLVGGSKYSVSGKETASGRWSSKGKLETSIVANSTINGVTRPTVVRKNFGEVTFSFAPDSTVEERRDMVAMVRDSLDPAKWPFQAFAQLQGVYGS